MINQEANELRESKPCCICNADQHKEVYQWPANYYSHQEFETASWDGRQSLPLSIVKCSSCQMVYTRPSFKLESLSLVYPDDIVPPEIKPDVVAIRKASLKTNLRSIFQRAITRAKKLIGRGPIWKINGKEMYLAKRGKLSDMFLVVARKR